MRSEKVLEQGTLSVWEVFEKAVVMCIVDISFLIQLLMPLGSYLSSIKIRAFIRKKSETSVKHWSKNRAFTAHSNVV